MDEGLDRQKGLTTHNTHNRHPRPRGIRTRNPSNTAPQTCALHRAATVIGESEALGQDKRNSGTTIKRVWDVAVEFDASLPLPQTRMNSINE
jgi:hypothetical protein